MGCPHSPVAILKILLHDNKTETCTSSRIVPQLQKAMWALVHLNTGSPTGSNHITLIVQSCLCTSQHSFRTHQTVSITCTQRAILYTVTRRTVQAIHTRPSLFA
jgi:hypothetical protein